MTDAKEFVDILIDKYGYTEFVGVPCSNLKSIINYASNLGMYTKATNEGDAVAYAAGKAMSGKKVAVLMQNSGITNAMSPITSLLYTFKIPILMIIGNRGVGPDEPQHELMGKITTDLLHMCGVEVVNIATDEVYPAIDHIDSIGTSVAILINKGELSKIDLVDSEDNRNYTMMTRSDVLECLQNFIDEDTIIVSTTGFSSREIYDKYDSERNFYMVGSMGCAISLASGLANSNPEKTVICVDGDGAVLMRPSGLYLADETACPNLIHLIIDNGTYESTGGQYTTANDLDISSDVAEIYDTAGSLLHQRVTTTRELKQAFRVLLSNDRTLNPHAVKSIVAYISNASDNSNLGRPKETMPEIKARFMNYLRKGKEDYE